MNKRTALAWIISFLSSSALLFSLMEKLNVGAQPLPPELQRDQPSSVSDTDPGSSAPGQALPSSQAK